MNLYPAIDIKNGNCVRLEQGDFDKVTKYSDSPVEMAKQFEAAGASKLHIVDLDGARSGENSNLEIIKEIVNNTSLFIEVGGGVRTIERVKALIECGINRVIIGTAAIENPQLVKDAVASFGDKIAVGVDARDGYVAIHGWEKVTETDSLTFCKQLEDVGVTTVIYTDIARDGMLTGPNLKVYEVLLKNTGLNIIASGGIGSIQDLVDLNKLGVEGAITGKAIYEGKFTVEEALQCLREE
ncbi:MAG: 1-(5-phosphoribosyl)-5-((5-phosphoribosylamino)methylideneamino) imidazole-4-carboxamide isomerase [Bacillales bacterium]|jgi:phosphoribosylformimino-5-aminoimidazole carboxamide ribotide isomerase|nr:1-(5-phosphoribosyl)-5-((5-phosphoribosylamino)methylideneamino) imidazole-4-carboxamide isomerase [Bacillales bacterium]